MVMVLLCCRYVEGGMGSVSMAVAKAAAESGATLATNAEVNNQSSPLWSYSFIDVLRFLAVSDGLT